MEKEDPTLSTPVQKSFTTKIHHLQQQSINSQKRTYTKWINEKIKNRRPILSVNDLFKDLRDGQVLLGLLEVFTRQPFPSEGTSRVQSMNNINTVIDHLKNVAKMKLHGISIEGILDGTANATLGLIWSIIHLYSIQKQFSKNSRKGIYLAESTTSTKKKLLDWASKKTSSASTPLPFSEVKKIKNFGSQWRDGRAFANLIHVIDKQALPKDVRAKFAKNGVRENLQMTFDIAEEKLGIPQFLLPEGKYICNLRAIVNKFIILKEK